MTVRFKLVLLIPLVIFLGVSSAYGAGDVYVVKSGDTLSKIAYSLQKENRESFLKEILAMPENGYLLTRSVPTRLQKYSAKSADWIFPGDRIVLPANKITAAEPAAKPTAPSSQSSEESISAVLRQYKPAPEEKIVPKKAERILQTMPTLSPVFKKKLRFDGQVKPKGGNPVIMAMAIMLPLLPVAVVALIFGVVYRTTMVPRAITSEKY